MDVQSVSPALLKTGTDAAGMTGGEAAEEFEAIIVAELLKAAREAGEAWGEEEKETGSESYLEFAEQHVAKILAKQGLFGFKRMAMEDFAESDRPASGEPLKER